MSTDYRTFDDTPIGDTPEPPHALILGGTGFLGRHIADAFLGKGWHVTVIHRSTRQPIMHPRLKSLRVDRFESEALAKTLEEDYFDCSIDLLGHDPESASAVVKALFGRTAHHIHLSSDTVYRVLKGVPRPWRAEDDEGPLIERNAGNATWFDTGLANRQADEVIKAAIREKGFPATIIRPTHVSGAHDSTLADYVHMLRILDGEPLVVPEPSGSFRHIHVSDLAAIMYRIHLNAHGTFGKVYNAAGGSVVNLYEYFDLLSVLLEKPLHLVPVPVDRCENLLADPGYPFYYSGDAFPDITTLETDLGFRPRGFEKFLPRVVEWFLTDYKGDPPDAFKALRTKEREFLESE